MSKKIVLLEKEYNGFESIYDLSRDIDEMWDVRFNENVKDVPGEFQGKVTVTITYEEN